MLCFLSCTLHSGTLPAASGKNRSKQAFEGGVSHAGEILLPGVFLVLACLRTCASADPMGAVSWITPVIPLGYNVTAAAT